MKYIKRYTERVDEKNGIICLVIMFTLTVTVNKMSQMAHFLHFPLTAAKNLSQSDAKHLSAPERCY